MENEDTHTMAHSALSVQQWTKEEVANWVRTVLPLSKVPKAEQPSLENSLKIIIDQAINGTALLVFRDDEHLQSVLHLLSGHALVLWGVISQMKALAAGPGLKRTASVAGFNDNFDNKKRIKPEPQSMPPPKVYLYVMPPRKLEDEPFDFENREKELLKFVEISIQNYQKLRLNQADNTCKYILPIASQMLGSGKTWFGRYMLKSLANKKDKLQTQFDKKALDYLASSHHILVDMRDVGKPYSTTRLIERLLDSLIFFCPKKFRKEAKRYWMNRPFSEIAITDVGRWFHSKLALPILFHFDEVDSILLQSSPKKIELTPSNSQLQSYYDFWDDIHQLHQYGFIYCAGRSPQLFFVGRQQLATRTSPGNSSHFFFDRLLLHNITTMVRSQIERNRIILHPDVAFTEIAQAIFKYTAGVPRLVTYALNYLAQISKENQFVCNKDVTGQGFFEKLYKYTNNSERGHAELSQWEGLTDNFKKLYLQLVIDAILAIPYTVEDLISVDALNIKDVSLLQIIWAIGIYTAKSPQYTLSGDAESLRVSDFSIPTAERIYIIVPPLVAYAISRSSETDFVLTLAGVTDYNCNKGNPQSNAGLLEYIGRQCMQNRLTTKLADLKKSPELHYLFPFLENSIFPKMAAELGGSTFCFPKFVNNKPNQWSNDKEEKLRSLLGTPFVPTNDSEDGSVSRSMELAHRYWSNLIKLVKPGLYAPGDEKSFSADLYAIFAHPSNANQLWILAIQFKSGEKVYTRDMVIEEVYKCYDLNLLAQTKPNEQKHVAGVLLIFVGGRLQDVPLIALNSHASCIDIVELVKKPVEQPKANVTQSSKKATGSTKPKQIVTKEEAEPKKQKQEYLIPTNANLQVLILNDLGKRHFLSAFNTVVTTNINTTV